MSPGVRAFFEKATSTLTYVVYDPKTLDAVVIDPVLDFDPAGARTSTTSVSEVVAFLKEQRLHARMILETHAHADHLSASQFLKAAIPNAPLAIGAGIRGVQATFKKIFDLPDAFPTDGRQFDKLLKDGETVALGSLALKVFATPGHTEACCSYLIGDALFTGDALFMPDSGTGRADFPGGDAKALFHSIKDRLYSLPDTTRTFPGHDYQPGGRPLQYESTLGDHKRANIHLKSSTTEAEFVAFRRGRDATLGAPKLLYPSVQINIDGGRLPGPSANGIRYLKIPVDLPQTR